MLTSPKEHVLERSDRPAPVDVLAVSGGYAYSGALEQAAADGIVTDTATLEAWLRALIAAGPQWNDAVFFAESWRQAQFPENLAAMAELARAMTGSARWVSTWERRCKCRI